MPEVTLQDDSMISQGLHHYALLLSLLISMQKNQDKTTKHTVDSQ